MKRGKCINCGIPIKYKGIYCMAQGCRNAKLKRWRREHPKEYTAQMRKWTEKAKGKPRRDTKVRSKIYHDKERFGGQRFNVLERDGYECQMCGMTEESHQQLWSRSLTIHHKDGNGRYSEKPNNDPNNLLTLCLRCHGKIDNRWTKKGA